MPDVELQRRAKLYGDSIAAELQRQVARDIAGAAPPVDFEALEMAIRERVARAISTAFAVGFVAASDDVDARRTVGKRGKRCMRCGNVSCVCGRGRR